MAEEAEEADPAAEVTAACTEAVEEDLAVAGAAQAEVAAAAVAAAGTAAGIPEIKEAEEEREGNIPSSFFIGRSGH